MRAATMLDVFAAMTAYLAGLGPIDKVIYKAVPADLPPGPVRRGSLRPLRHGARLIRRDIATAVVPGARLPIKSDKKNKVNKARNMG